MSSSACERKRHARLPLHGTRAAAIAIGSRPNEITCLPSFKSSTRRYPLCMILADNGIEMMLGTVRSRETACLILRRCPLGRMVEEAFIGNRADGAGAGWKGNTIIETYEWPSAATRGMTGEAGRYYIMQGRTK
ncbi:hypothetical protein GLOTRDRAFT_90277 [Gloeophyllum trabeum ATCC 11539]|uniref:Uncharacterized protein n=1 Tax=Gloeophyllum trabeum (strain ATCC 11539 / FP-39264 / Madison 617) TaxID=670483 RepID=S7QN16_GLOTA|nr:uncharacterized protein GLOTRDRAFT_90277 [Gloeophyllum trabeum ATCC 11539]EPQ60951.1 hypothetical protein GLOTRDRAFT_90277 [Gloeophyllum trabeum ATCC 11539]